LRGKDARLDEILEDGKAVIVPMDHGVTEGPIKGLTNMEEIIRKVEENATAIVLHKGILKTLKRKPKCGIIMHLSASTTLAPDPNAKVQIAEVEEAIRLGADAVSVHVNIGGSDGEPDMLGVLGRVAGECERFQIPLLAMMYPRGRNVRNPLDPKFVAHVARVGAELGADLVKTLYTGSIETFKQVVEGCPVPVVIAGGPKCENDIEVLEMVRGAIDAGSIGVSIGRNVFQHEKPEAMLKAIRKIVIDNASIEDALEELR